jgi:hypothetical protein
LRKSSTALGEAARLRGGHGPTPFLGNKFASQIVGDDLDCGKRLAPSMSGPRYINNFRGARY